MAIDTRGYLVKFTANDLATRAPGDAARTLIEGLGWPLHRAARHVYAHLRALRKRDELRRLDQTGVHPSPGAVQCIQRVE